MGFLEKRLAAWRPLLRPAENRENEPAIPLQPLGPWSRNPAVAAGQAPHKKEPRCFVDIALSWEALPSQAPRSFGSLSQEARAPMYMVSGALASLGIGFRVPAPENGGL